MAVKQEARIGIYYGWSETEGWADQMDINLRRIAFLLNPSVINRTQTSPPVSPVDGAAYIVASPATGTFVGLENQFMVWSAADGNWLPIVPKDGQEAVVISEGTWGTRIVFKGGAWSPGVALG
ncbi:MAG TPA: DUF2793 domain-containing protein [Cellvibrio sp.]|nr:DUF2793 domain-containing protein [Cellvibrio sp.]